jgi:hypothetical protein
MARVWAALRNRQGPLAKSRKIRELFDLDPAGFASSPGFIHGRPRSARISIWRAP